ncbi:sarcoglycan complex subunit protein [Teladorsagia circumcincta]|uniref:Sarcoglycan complex subunit protein n=1 Tax=Teladorsagia circumcincta TaxID=45464 RepID=A0A2G9UPU1_TELCI|nr:sarcoglycan complex subunit protein [Teladorsagia circumcincta]
MAEQLFLTLLRAWLLCGAAASLMSARYPLYGVNDDALWARGSALPEPSRGASIQQLHPSMPYATYPGTTTHTTVVHSAMKPVADADIYRVGIYGWRKRCLYFFILILTIVIVLNLALTAWIMSVLDFSTDGMGALKIQDDGIRVEGRAQFDKPVTFSHLSTEKDEALVIDSFRGIHMQARNSSGHVSARMSLTADGKTQAVCDRFEVFDPDNRLLFFADSQEIGLKLENLRILGNYGFGFFKFEAKDLRAKGMDIDLYV